MSRYVLARDKEFIVEAEDVEGNIFLHIHLEKVTASIVKRLRILLDKVTAKYDQAGHDVIFMTTRNENIIKLWNMIRPCYTVQPLGRGHGWVGSWLTFEES